MSEKLRILKMVEEGKITAEQAVELMSTMGVDEEGNNAITTGAKAYDKKMFRVIVDSKDGDKVNVQFPVGAIKRILKATGKLPIPDEQLQGMDLSEIMDAVSSCLEEEIEGDFVNVNSADGDTVRIYVG